MFRVTIEEIEDGESVSLTMRSDESLGLAIGLALKRYEPARDDETLSEIIRWMEIWSDHEFFDGHNQAIAKMNEAAELILAGWREHDKKTR